MVNILTSQHVLLCKMLRRSRVLGGVVALSYPMIGENRQLVTNEPVEVQDCRKITDYFRGIYRISPKLMKETGGCRHVTGWNCKHLGSRPVMPKNLPDHWAKWRVHLIRVPSFRARSSCMAPKFRLVWHCHLASCDGPPLVGLAGVTLWAHQSFVPFRPARLATCSLPTIL